ncbi:FAD-dependent monooxygenase, partial [Salmonella enterica subsp. enterica serovar Anatum]|nr:FAD-dependent monooxygenase [Salmonella enterica subsp. enterica serovar Anatum]
MITTSVKGFWRPVSTFASLTSQQSRETIECDVLIVGAGPAGLSAALKLKLQANDAGKELSIIV